MTGLDTVTIIGIVVALLGLAGGCVWWASAMQAKLDMLLTMVLTAKTTSDDLGARVIKIEKDIVEMKAQR